MTAYELLLINELERRVSSLEESHIEQVERLDVMHRTLSNLITRQQERDSRTTPTIKNMGRKA